MGDLGLGRPDCQHAAIDEFLCAVAGCAFRTDVCDYNSDLPQSQQSACHCLDWILPGLLCFAGNLAFFPRTLLSAIWPGTDGISQRKWTTFMNKLDQRASHLQR